MKRTWIAIIMLVGEGIAYAPAATSVSQYGITLHFGGNYTIGQYCTWDYWVIDPNPSSDSAGVAVSGSTHESVSGVGSGEAYMKNPQWGKQAYEPRQGGYDGTLAITLPVSLNAGDCLVATTSLEAFTSQTWIYSCMILTVVDSIQPQDVFRPPYTRPSRVGSSAADPLRFLYGNVSPSKWALFPGKARAGIPSVPDIASTMSKVRGPWLDHLGESWGGEIHPMSQMKAYGEYLTQDLSEAAAQLCLDYGLADIKTLSG